MANKRDWGNTFTKLRKIEEDDLFETDHLLRKFRREGIAKDGVV